MTIRSTTTPTPGDRAKRPTGSRQWLLCASRGLFHDGGGCGGAHDETIGGGACRADRAHSRSHPASHDCADQNHLQLHNLCVDTVITCGVITNGCVESTVRGGRDLGFKMIVASDCCASWTRELHERSLRYLAVSFGNVRESANLVVEFAAPCMPAEVLA